MAQLNISEAITTLSPLIQLLFGIVIYSLFTYKFYRFVAEKDIFKLNLQQYNTTEYAALKKFLNALLYVIEYILLFPFFTFFWFIVLALLLSFLMKEQTVQIVLLVSIAVVGAIRITSYYAEDLSRDLAKMLPFALLGIFLIDITSFTLTNVFSTIKQMPSQWEILTYYLLFTVFLEFILRITHGIFRIIVPERREKATKN